MSVIIPILIFNLLIVLHELGHFIAAKSQGVHVNEFSVGFGPRLLSKNFCGTIFSLKIVPFGGSCTMYEETEAGIKDTLTDEPVWKRMLIFAAGPIANFCAGICLAFILIVIQGYDAPIIGNIEQNSIASEIGLCSQAKILSINDKKILRFREIGEYMQSERPGELEIEYELYGHTYHKKYTNTNNIKRSNYSLGLVASQYKKCENCLELLSNTAYEIAYWGRIAKTSLKLLVTGKVSVMDLSGPVGIIEIMGNVYSNEVEGGGGAAMFSMINMAIMLSVNLGIMNLLPIPALDGGHLFFCFLEICTKKQISKKIEEKINLGGLVALMLLMVFILINDIRKIIMI